MSLSIRPATPRDLPGIVSLLIEDAQQRKALDPLLWRSTASAPGRIEAALSRDLWLVAEDAGMTVGIMRAMIVPVPPIYDGAASRPGLLADDCVVSADAASGTGEALLAAAEGALRQAGATTLIASCPATGPLRPLYERHGYEPVTLYMAKHRFSAGALPRTVRPASAEDVPAIVKLSAAHRQTLASVNPRFWHIHPEADGRFGAWMRRSLTLQDRDMRVAGAPVRGYVIAQPCSPLLMPIAHDVAGIGVIDDFYDEDFTAVAALANGGSSGASLLAAAEGAFAQRGVDSAIVICPAAWSSKIALLERSGYRTAKLWMLRR